MLAVEQEVLTAAPKFKCLPENNAAKGFFERAAFEAILPRLTMRGKVDTDVQDFVTWAYYTGMLVRPRVHDFPAQFVRNMVRAGVPEKTAMAISGHRQAVKQNSDYLSVMPAKSNLLKMVQ